MQVMQLVVGMIGTNCYLLVNEINNEAIVVDPGDNGEQIAGVINEKGLKAKAILLTHGHCDHTEGIEDLKSALAPEKVELYALDKEEPMLTDPKMNQSVYMGCGAKTYPADVYVTDGQKLTIAGLSFTVIATPGHTPGGCCYYFDEDRVLVSGDTLFRQSVGRTDFPGGSTEALLASIEEKLFTLPDDTVVLPGHNEQTTIAFEKQHNPFLQ